MHTTMTVCKICNINKEDTRENWYFHGWKRWWLKCKSCTLEWRKTEHERIMSRKRDMDRYYNSPKRREYIFRTWAERRERKWYSKVHSITRNKIRNLGIRPNVCPICWNNGRIIAHHPDYSKRYEIVFCCQICHDKIHKWKIECPKCIDLRVPF